MVSIFAFLIYCIGLKYLGEAADVQSARV